MRQLTCYQKLVKGKYELRGDLPPGREPIIKLELGALKFTPILIQSER